MGGRRKSELVSLRDEIIFGDAQPNPLVVLVHNNLVFSHAPFKFVLVRHFSAVIGPPTPLAFPGSFTPLDPTSSIFV